MNESDLNDISDLVFFTNRALQCEVRSNMRKISVEYNNQEKRFILYVYYDRPLTQKELDYDIAGTIIAEISSNFSNSLDISWEDKIIILPYPQRLPDEGICVYRRYEPSPKNELRKYMNKPANLNDIGDLVFYTSRALQCEIRADMRKISIAYNNKAKRFILYVYYDRPLTQEELDYDIAGTIIAELNSYFPDFDDVLWEDKTIILPYPKRLPPEEGVCVYRRYEPCPQDEQ